MKVRLIGNTKVVNLILPPRIYGNYWLTDEYNQNLVSVYGKNNKWIMKSNSDVKILLKDIPTNEVELEQNKFYVLWDKTKNIRYRTFVGETFDSKMLLLDFNEVGPLTFYIGDSSKINEGSPNYVSYEEEKMFSNQLEITRNNGMYYLKNLHPEVNVYVNNELVTESNVYYGDVVFIEGLTFSFVGNMLLLGTVDDNVKYASNKFRIHKSNKLDYQSLEKLTDEATYETPEYYVRPPRFSQVIEEKELAIDTPPKSQEREETPILLTLAPMLIMGMGSSVTGVIALVNVISGTSTLKENFVSILTAVCMLGTMLIFPSINKAYQKRRDKKNESLRQTKYRDYLNKMETIIANYSLKQKSILLENNASFEELGNIILKKQRGFWERRINHDDFLTIRLGIGNVETKLRINSSKEHFELHEDDLENELHNLIKKYHLINDVPVTLSLKKNYVSGIIGNNLIVKRYMDGIIINLIAYHSYDEVKLVIFTNKENENYWKKLKDSPYCWNNEKDLRFFSCDNDDASRVSSYLEDIFRERLSDNNKEIKYDTHYLIIVDDFNYTSKLGAINNVLKSDTSHGFSILYLTDKITSLPGECQMFINIDASLGEMFAKEGVNKKQEFKVEFPSTTIDAYIYEASNIIVEPKNGIFELPTLYTFTEMYDVGNVEQLNAYNLWQKNDPTSSLSCPVGIGENGELFKIDLHEKVHGPHGLIAGMTGSGKSEFIITYILSMAINYHPNEVQFVIIDYKGGGLAGAFENKETGEKLPHLAGTITNLDTNEINRSLSSLQSELKRRQRIFNTARDENGESTIDIYKYQKLYRDGKVKEPIAHLMIICDEFAELKVDQPEFMSELISTSRIGRSLGVHLILATQKPSGVVDEQIWSNSKFRVCLKVQDKSDSNDMIKSPDAAYLKETGRFYLQVGFNEFFAKGQSAWAGAPYYESDKRKKLIDNSINFLDNIGGKIKSIDDGKQDNRGIHKGEELQNILEYLQNIGNEQGIIIKKLWLDSIPAFITIDKLKIKYKYVKEDYNINPVLGEYDAPKEQVQKLLTIPLNSCGNLIVYGSVGSGKENFISSLIYSLISTYSSEEVNIYILDFGTQMLNMYSKVNHIGDIINSADTDKMDTFFKMVNEIINLRKKIFMEYNGSYDYFIKKSNKKLPLITIIINGFESFMELFADYADQFTVLSREGQKYGVCFIVTVSAVNNIRMKISQNFNEKITLQMNDSYDYRQVLGKTDVVPGKIFGRGLVKREDIYEFQTASIIEEDKISDYIEEYITNINKKYPVKANRIPTLPDVVSTSFVSSSSNGLSFVPIGVGKQNLNILGVNFTNDISLLVSAQKTIDTKKFLLPFIYELGKIQNNSVYVIDSEKILKPVENVKYFNTSFEKIFESFNENVEKFNNIYESNDYDASSLNNYSNMLFVIIGINKIKTILGTNFETLVAKPMMSSKRLSKINYVIVDSFDNLKKLEYDNWYKDIINSSRGIWIGNGLADQNVFRLAGTTRAISGNIPNNFGYNIVSGNPTLFKYIESIDDEEETL